MVDQSRLAALLAIKLTALMTDHGVSGAVPGAFGGGAVAVAGRTGWVLVDAPNAGLGAALEDLAGGVSGRGVTVQVDVDAAAAEALTDEDQRLVYRMTSECLRNIVKHAAARRARVTLHQDGALLVLEITDDGVGLSGDAAAAAAREGHLGLRLLADLARDHGATLRLASAPGQGTRWRLEVARP